MALSATQSGARVFKRERFFASDHHNRFGSK